MAVTINASTTAGLVQTADTTGNLSLQSNGTTIAALTSAGLAVTGAGSFSTTLGVTGSITTNDTLVSSIGGIITNLTASGSAIFGTTSNHGLLLRTNNTTRITIDNAGAVTIPGTLGVTGTSTLATVNASGTGTFTKQATFGDALLFTNTDASNKTGYFYSDSDTIGMFNIASGAAGGSGIYFRSGSPAVKVQVASSGVIGDFTSTGLSVTGTLGAGVTTISGAGTAQALNVDATSGAYAVFKTAGTDSGYIGLGVFGSGATAGSFGLRSVNNMQFAVGSSAVNMTIDTGGIVTMAAYGAGAATFSSAGVISSVSDETWKTKDGIPTNPDAMLNKLEPGYWYYNDEKKETFGKDRQLGFYAQNVNAAIGPEAAPEPETVTTKNEDGTETTTTKPWGYYDRSVLAITVMSLQKALTRLAALEAK